MGKRAKFKIVVGEKERQSEIWTVNITKSDVYLTTTSGKDTKISLHESGQAFWSIRSEALQNVPFVPPAGRHLAQWQSHDVSMDDMGAFFFLLFPDSELRSERPQESEVIRIPAPGPLRGVRVNFSLTIPLQASPDLIVLPSLSLLFCHQLANAKWLVATSHAFPIPDSLVQRMDGARAEAWATAEAQGLNPVGTKAAARVIDKHGVSGLVEVAPYIGIFG